MPKMKVPFGTITITDSAKALVLEALEKRRVSTGKFVREFEEKFAALFGSKHAVAVSTGTDADTLALAVLHDLGARRGDEVIVPSLSFVATGNAVLHAGLTPRFVDINRDTLNLDPDRIRDAITERTRAIMPVHLMGKPADMDAIMHIAKEFGLVVVEDAAEAHAGSYRGKPLGTIGDMGAFSLYVAHIISTIEGGIIITDNEQYAEILLSLRAHGRGCKCVQCVLSTAQTYCDKRFNTPDGEDRRFSFERVGYSAKMNELEAAVGLGTLEKFDEIVAKRRANLLFAIEHFKEFAPYLSTITEEPWEKIGPHALPIIVNEEASFSRAQFSCYLEENGVETRTLFASMPTQCPGFAFLGYEPGEFPEAEYVGKNGLHIGVHHGLGIAEMEYAIDVIRQFLTRNQD